MNKWCVILLLPLFGCAEARFKSKMDDYIGRDIGELQMKYGSARSTGGGYYEWLFNYGQRTDVNLYLTGRYTASGTSNTYDVYCDLNVYTAADGKIMGWKSYGNACRQSIWGDPY